MPEVVGVQIARDRLIKVTKLESLRDITTIALVILNIVCLVALLAAVIHGIVHTKAGKKGKKYVAADQFYVDESWFLVPTFLLWSEMFIILLYGIFQDVNEKVYLRFYTWAIAVIFITFSIIILVVYAGDLEPNLRKTREFLSTNRQTYNGMDPEFIEDNCVFRKYFKCCARDNFNREYPTTSALPDCCCDTAPCDFKTVYRKTCEQALRDFHAINLRFMRHYYISLSFLMFTNLVFAIFLYMMIHFRHDEE